MPIPSYEDCMQPLLAWAADGDAKSLHDAYEMMAQHFDLTAAERTVSTSSRSQALYKNRVRWAKTYLTQAGLLEGVSRGYFRITALGKDVATNALNELSSQYLKRFKGFQKYTDSDEYRFRNNLKFDFMDS